MRRKNVSDEFSKYFGFTTTQKILKKNPENRLLSNLNLENLMDSQLPNMVSSYHRNVPGVMNVYDKARTSDDVACHIIKGLRQTRLKLST